MRLMPLPCLLFFALGCPGDTGTDSGDGKDSGDTGDTDVDLGPPGCINLNGEEGDFATITDAMVYAAGGDTVNVCAGAYSERVSVPAGVFVVGEGSVGTSIDAPVNEPAFDLTGAGGGVSGFTITGTRSGVTLDGAADVVLTDLVFDAMGNYGIESVNSTNVAVTASSFSLPALGGVYVAGGSATIDGCTFSEPTSYGVWAANDAVVSLSNNTFTMVHATTNDGSDGHAVFVDAAAVTMVDNVISGNDLIGIWADGGSLSMTGDVVADTPYAVVSQGTEFVASGVSIFGATSQGLFVTAPTPVVITDTTVALNGGATTGLVSCSNDYSGFNGFCGGMYIEATEISLSGVLVSQYESFGIFAGPPRNKELTLTVQDVTVDDVGRWGLYTDSATATIDGLTVSNQREPDSEGLSCYSVDRASGLVLSSSEATITNSHFDASEGWGLSVVLARADVATSSFSDNGCAGAVNYQGTLDVSGTTFGPNGEWGGVFDYQGATTLDSNTFVDTARTRVDLYDDGAGGFYRYEYTNSGRDFYAVSSGSCIITNNTFTGGDSSLFFELTGCLVSGNRWTDYAGSIIYNYQGDSSDPVSLATNTVDDVAGPIVYSVYGHTEVEDLQVGSTRAYEYAYAYYYIAPDGTETLQYSGTSTYGQPAFEAYGYHYAYWSDTDGDGVNDTYTDYSYPSGLSLKNVSVESTYGSLIEATEGALELVDVTVGDVGGYAVYDYWSYFAPEVEIEGLSVGSSAYTALEFDGNTADLGYVDISDVEIEVTTGSGLRVTGIDTVSVSGFSVLDADNDGVYVGGDYSYYDYDTSTYISGTLAPLIELSGVEIFGAGSSGIELEDGTPYVEACVAEGGDGTGLVLTDTTAEVESSEFSYNTSYGMECNNTTLNVCMGNLLDGNTAGTHLGCSDECTY